jgi:coenzyme F420-dependent glucose-6-phosphate dehydrogenase
MADGLIGLAPERELLQTFDESGGKGKPRYAEINVCWGEDREAAQRMVLERWPNGGAPGELPAELPLPRHFQQVGSILRAEDVAEKFPCGPEAEPYLDSIRTYARAGYDHIWIHQIGPEQEGFMRFVTDQIMPRKDELATSAA